MPKTLPSKLDLLKREQFDPQTKEARIARALAALDAGPTLRLTPEQWKDAARIRNLRSSHNADANGRVAEDPRWE